MKVATILALAATFSVAQAQEPLMSHAKKALANKNIRPWERAWYKKVVSGAVKPKHVRVWQTTYGPWEGYKGDTYHIAANPCNMKPGTVVWLKSTKRIMVVTNRGDSYNDVRARNHGCAFWVDIWVRHRGQYPTGNGDMWILGKVNWKH